MVNGCELFLQKPPHECFETTTPNIVFSVTTSICLAQYKLQIAHVSVISTKCEPNMLCHSL
jgi:hypothetical protein